MRIPRIYCPISLSIGSHIDLPPTASNHVVRVLRLKVGANLILFNGTEGEFHGVLATVTRSAATVRIHTYHPREAESPLPILLAQGISRGERMDYTLQKAVELGVSVIFPVLAERSVVKLEQERWRHRIQHWQGIIASACEQCGRNRLPLLLEPVGLAKCLQSPALQGLKLVLDPLAPTSLSALALSPSAVSLLIGPEGGLSPTEVALAEVAGFTAVRLGPRVLRTETAALVALTAVQLRWGDLG
ncbi:MAG TPA: 16S rRNA (uracil(1498)-N(3))-methyltransferase [Candidatus Competibacteraceae bacterium]|nr:16S rRNA (uracil(1498)-N(3))-methyltransferase [Candidatus Competibacteraceae bacterium]